MTILTPETLAPEIIKEMKISHALSEREVHLIFESVRATVAAMLKAALEPQYRCTHCGLIVDLRWEAEFPERGVAVPGDSR